MVSTGLIAIVPAPATTPLPKVVAMVAFTQQCREIMKTIVVSERDIEADVRRAGGWFFKAAPERLDVPAPRLSLLTDVAAWYEHKDGEVARFLMQLDPVYPVADPVVVFECLQRLMVNAMADGILGVSDGNEVGLSPDGWIDRDAAGPLRIDGTMYAFRHDFALHNASDWLADGKFLPYHSKLVGETPRGPFI